jgi:hypothetical protein
MRSTISDPASEQFFYTQCIAFIFPELGGYILDLLDAVVYRLRKRLCRKAKVVVENHIKFHRRYSTSRIEQKLPET